MRTRATATDTARDRLAQILKEVDENATDSDDSVGSAKFMKTKAATKEQLTFTQEYINERSREEVEDDEVMSQDLLKDNTIILDSKPEDEQQVLSSQPNESPSDNIDPSDRDYFCHCFDICIKEIKRATSENIKSIENLYKKTEKAEEEHVNEISNYLDKLNKSQSETDQQKLKNTESDKRLRSLNAQHRAEIKELKAKKSEKEGTLELEV